MSDEVERVQSRSADESGRAEVGSTIEEAVVSLLLTTKGRENHQVGSENDEDGFHASLTQWSGSSKVHPPFQDLVWGDDDRLILVEAKRNALTVAWRQQSSLAAWVAGTRARLDRVRDAADAELAPLLLRTAEEATGLASCTSGIAHGFGEAPPSGRELAGEVVDLLCRFAPNPNSESAAWVERVVLETLASKYGIFDPAQPDQPAEALAHFVDEVESVAAALRTVVQDILLGGVQRITHLDCVPRNESSPCGVARLASPIVPGAPGLGLTTVPIDFVLAV
ncbi:MULTISPECIES: hypothetical protein [Streptomyces griseus group]|uniref:hypothetical protein n=1 Tax=Streptomyces griseus group TaxID=629295 RepID=UPI0034610E7B